ncbi:MAG: putative toxin-antitoxin system toxin component, PIN family [Betaproteobacteria bacterium RBG_16_58_11]|nr:MAG: putative toxin-antitoxin system toxin component, PIN family [Betaproteobacteria bacterium RBG_16_58_11]OGA00348.1 MAG: putative toxin-antitoxin system toxin component, PIN family [Betaproteobacteria bacterium RBG_19FT_COMBO_58_11]
MPKRKTEVIESFGERLAQLRKAAGFTQVEFDAEVVEAPPLPQPVCRDPDDDAVLAAAIAGQVDLIVSGDDDLLCLKQFQNIPILSPAEVLQFIEADR